MPNKPPKKAQELPPSDVNEIEKPAPTGYSVNITYEVVTEESASEGDVADRGFEEEDLEFESVEDIASYLESNYHWDYAEWSGSPAQQGDWLTLVKEQQHSMTSIRDDFPDALSVMYGVHFTTNGERGLPLEDMKKLTSIIGGVHGMKANQQKKADDAAVVPAEGIAEENPKFKVKFSPSIWDILYQRYEGQSDPLYALVSRTPNGLETDATIDELLSAREELMAALEEGDLDEGLASEVTSMIMDFDELLFSGGTGEKALPNVVDDAVDKLDTLFPTDKKGTKKRAVGFPNMLSNDTKKWIQLQTTNLAAKKGAPATPEQAHAYIDEAAVEVAQELANAIGPEVKKVVDEFRDKIFQDVTSGVEMAAPQAKPAAPPIVPPTAPVAEPAPAVEPVAASLKKAKMSDELKKAFDSSYAYDAIAFVLDAELGSDFYKRVNADEVIDEEESILDLVQQDFPNASRKELAEAFGEVLTDAYAQAE